MLRWPRWTRRRRLTVVETLDTLQAEIGAWAEATFKDRPPIGVVKHLRREVEELAMALIAGESTEEETADILILALNHAHLHGFSALAAVQAKMAKNRARRWGPPDSEGVMEHVREAASPHRALAAEVGSELKPAPAWAYRPLRPDEHSRVAEGAGDPLPRVSESELAALRDGEMSVLTGDDADDDWETLAAEVVAAGDPEPAVGWVPEGMVGVAGAYEVMLRREEAGR